MPPQDEQLLGGGILLPSTFYRKVFFSVLCFSVFCPHFEIGRGLEIGMDDLLVLVVLPLFFGRAILSRSTASTSRLCLCMVWWAVLLSGGIGYILSWGYLGHPVVPTEMWQYVKRMVFFYIALELAMSGQSLEYVFRVLVAVAIIASLIGLCQSIYPPLGSLFTNIYGRTDDQILKAMTMNSSASRLVGIAGHSIAWGGFSMFCAILGLSRLIVSESAVVKNSSMPPPSRLTAVFVFLLGGGNVLLSGSRIAVSALAVVIAFSIILGGYMSRFKIRYLAITLGSCTALTVAIVTLLRERLSFLVYRFIALGEEGKGILGREEQVLPSLELLDGLSAWTFGVGKAYLTSIVPYTEVEPVYLLVCYGVVGLCLRYGILFYIFWCGLRCLRDETLSVQMLSLSAVISVVGYSVFSLGYYFFQELYVGLLPWLLFGAVVGLWLRHYKGPAMHYRPRQVLTAGFFFLLLMNVTKDVHAAPPLPAPIILSYYWPSAGEYRGLDQFDLSTANIIDLLPGHEPKKARIFWEQQGRIILNRVYPFRSEGVPLVTEDEIFENILKNLATGHGIIIDEILGNRLSSKECDLLIRVLKHARDQYPDKYIFIWGSSVWKKDNLPLLIVIRDTCDIFIPELYISESDARQNGLGVIGKRLAMLESQAPGLLAKTVVGLGLFQALDDDPNISIADHLVNQIKYLSNSHIGKLRGVAFCAPTYGSSYTLQVVDRALNKEFFP